MSALHSSMVQRLESCEDSEVGRHVDMTAVLADIEKSKSVGSETGKDVWGLAILYSVIVRYILFYLSGFHQILITARLWSGKYQGFHNIVFTLITRLSQDDRRSHLSHRSHRSLPMSSPVQGDPALAKLWLCVTETLVTKLSKSRKTGKQEWWASWFKMKIRSWNSK